jgi:hypothetical protein
MLPLISVESEEERNFDEEILKGRREYIERNVV